MLYKNTWFVNIFESNQRENQTDFFTKQEAELWQFVTFFFTTQPAESLELIPNPCKKSVGFLRRKRHQTEEGAKWSRVMRSWTRYDDNRKNGTKHWDRAKGPQTRDRPLKTVKSIFSTFRVRVSLRQNLSRKTQCLPISLSQTVWSKEPHNYLPPKLLSLYNRPLVRLPIWAKNQAWSKKIVATIRLPFEASFCWSFLLQTFTIPSVHRESCYF